MTHTDETTPLLGGHVNVGDAITHNPGVSASTATTNPSVPPTEEDFHPRETDDAEANGAPVQTDGSAESPTTGSMVQGVNLAGILPGLMIGVCLAAMDGTIVVSSYGKIGSAFKSLEKTSWIATSYLLTTTSFQPLYGKLSDIYGRKACLMFAYTVFAIGSAWCGLARSMNELIIARAFAGIGGGGMTTLVSILMSDIVPLRRRGAWQGYINLVYAAGAAAGAPLGGFLADTGKHGWRWAFLFQVPLTMLAALCVSAFLNLPPRHTENVRNRFYRIDFIGAMTLVLAVFSILVGLESAGTSSTTPSSRTAMLIALPVGIALFVFFWVVEAKIAIDPFAPIRIVTDISLLACYLCNLLQFASFFAILFYVPLYFQAVADLSASRSGLRMLPAIAGSVTGSISAGLIMQKTGRYYWLTVIAYFLSAVATVPILLATGLLGKRSYTAIELGLALLGFGNGVGVTSSLIAMIARAGNDDQAVATAVSYLFRSLGSVLGVSISSTVLQAVLRTRLHKELRGRVAEGEIEEFVRKATESLDFLKDLPQGIKLVIVESYERAVRYPFVLSMALGVMCVICSFAIKEVKLKH